MKFKTLITTLFLILIHIQTRAYSGVSCPVNANQKKILEEAVIRGRLEAAWIITQSAQSSFPSRGFSRNLIGSSAAHTGVFTLIEQCTEPRTFDQFCEDCEGDNCPTQRRCSQLACEAANIDTAKIWWEPAPFTYTSDQPFLDNYRVRYQTIPTTLIRYDGTTPNLLKIDWSANDRVRVTKNGKTYDVRSILNGEGERTPDAPRFAQVEIIFPELVQSQAFIKVNFRINEQGVVSGKITSTKRQLAVITESPTEENTAINWIGLCQ